MSIEQRAKGAELNIKIKRELFRFRSEQEWINKARSWYANCGVRKGYYITVDAKGHVMHVGKCFMEATRLGLYPVVVYELETNWRDDRRDDGVAAGEGVDG